MNLQFNCPQCGLAIQASTDSAGGTAQCPQCGQQFMVEASVPALPVVKARAVPAAAPHPANPSPPQARTRPPQARPGPPGHPHAPARPRFEPPPPPPNDASNDKLRFIGLAVAGALLVIVAIWIALGGGQPKPKPRQSSDKPSAEEIAKQEAAAEITRVNLELKKIQDSLAEKEKEEAKRQREEAERKQEEWLKNLLAQQIEQAKKRAEYESVRNSYAERFFSSDSNAAEAFISALNTSLRELVDLLGDGDDSNDPKTKEACEEYLIKRLIWRFERDPVLSQWIKEHKRDPKKLVQELVQGSPQRAGSGPPPKAFDFTKYGSMGSGFLISSDGWILTNEHVVSDAKVVDLRLRDGKILQATVVKTDEANDLAILKADLTAESWLAVSKGDTDLTLGRTVFTVGYPDPMVLGVEPKFADGRISAASGIGDRKDSYQTTVPVQHGNSGGALVDFATGWVVGVVNARLENRSGPADNVSYAIKGKVVSTFFESVPEAKAAAAKILPKPLAKGDERAVIDRVTDSAILILRQR
ncbi:MAG: trypsin-like peptidase domain-containing protein [Verrucomicrobia bacterium]|nr:trypsin-like peptidase domain-containing protein [Verrucomicrobiota bacterium]